MPPQFSTLSRRFALVCFALFALAPRVALAIHQPPSESKTRLRYEVSVSNLSQRTLHIALRVDAPPIGKLQFGLPAWTPGYYQILPYERNLSQVRAKTPQGETLTVTQDSPRSWSLDLPENAKQITLHYDIKADDQGYGFFGASLRKNVGYINGASTFLYLPQAMQAPVVLEMRLPATWKTSTGLRPLASGSSVSEPTQFVAENYDELIDCPLQFGIFDRFTFSVAGATIECALVGDHRAHIPKLTRTLEKTVRAGKALFGSLPFSKYLFLFHCGGEGFDGGLEHRNSTCIHISGALGDGMSDEALPTIVHEFLHTWNVKRIRPQGLGPFDYTQAVRSPSVWFAEGVTDYYAHLLMVRSGMRTPEGFIREIESRIQELDATPTRRAVSLEEASKKAWEGGSMGYDGLSYYLKGSLVGFYFDLKIRTLTQGKKSLDDVMRSLDADFGAKNIAYPEDAIKNALSAVAGTSLDSDYAAYVQGVEEIPWERALPLAGFQFDRGRTSILGVSFGSEPSTLQVKTVMKGFAAEKMGVLPEDTILALNGSRVSVGTIRERLQSLRPGTPITLDVLRAQEPMKLKGAIDFQFTPAVMRLLDPQRVSAEAQRIRASLFRSSGSAPAPTKEPSR